MIRTHLISLLISLNMFLGLVGVNSRMEFVRKEVKKNVEKNLYGINDTTLKKHFYIKPIINVTEFTNENKTYEILDFYREITMIKGSSELPIKKMYIETILIPKTDAKIAKLKAETAYIETKNAAKKKSMNLIAEDFKKNTPLTNLTTKLLNISIPINNTEVLNSIYNETFYYLNNKNVSNSTRIQNLENS